MSSGISTSVNLGTANVATASHKQRQAMLRQATQEMVGVTFFGEMLKMARNSKLKSKIGHGGRGEEIFGNQLDAEFARRVGQGTPNSLSESIYKRLSKNV